MHRDDINELVKWRLGARPEQDNKPAEQDYWVKLLMKGHETPKELTVGEAFELGRYCERMFQGSRVENSEFTLRHVIPYTRYLNGKLGL